MPEMQEVQDFRRFIISVVGILEILFVIAATLLGGLIGAAIPGLVSGGGAGFIGFLIGGFSGFCLSALVVGISMNLTEIAKNTQRTVELLEYPTGKASKRKPKNKDDGELTEEEKEEARILLEQRGIR